uniref:hypothetical protein n=1 Tax=Micromonospora acroterricola TaxID=2202421 RepID=UPI001F2F497E
TAPADPAPAAGDPIDTVSPDARPEGSASTDSASPGDAASGAARLPGSRRPAGDPADAVTTGD